MLPGKSNISVQGEIVEWRQDLRAGDQDLKRNVLKKGKRATRMTVVPFF
jgi:ribosomal protein L15E